MIRFSTYFLLIFIWALILKSSSSITAQETSIGISWDNPPSVSNQISTQLFTFENIGVQFLELQHPVNTVLLDSISNYPFQVLIRFDKKYLTTSEVRENNTEIIRQYSSLILEYAEYESVIAYGLYSFSQSFNVEFIAEFESISNELSQISNREFYEITSGSFNALDFSMYEITSDMFSNDISAFLLSKESSPDDAHLLNKLFDKRPRVLFLDSKWFFSAIQLHPYLLPALQDFNNGDEFILPLKKTDSIRTTFNWPVLVFVLIWISMGIHITLSQTYKPLIFRYFTGHRFFIDDVMRYRDRSYLSGIFLFFQHAFFTGLVIYILSSLLISETGMDVLYFTIPQLAIFGQNYFSLFAIGTIITVLLQLVALSWLYFPSKSMTHFSQTLTLFTWVFHLDFLIVSVMLILLLTGGSTNLILFLGLLFLLNWLVAFFLTSFDSSKYLLQKRISYIFYTFGLHTLLNIGLFILILSSESIMDFLELVILL
ncbi:MAG: hypothetical protein BalsKO_05330 [Balneolaceae bacterium]